MGDLEEKARRVRQAAKELRGEDLPPRPEKPEAE